MTFEELFADDKARLDHSLSANALEQNHLRRCMALVRIVEWGESNRSNEMGRLLGPNGTLLFDQTLARIQQTTAHLADPQLQNPRQLLTDAMFVHDLGKYDEALGAFSGSGHEERSAQIVLRQRDGLIQQLGWSDESADLLIGLARFHSILGIIHLGGASMVYLLPLLEWLLPLDDAKQRLFLDLLIVLNCCDAGASGNFETQHFYLNQDRLETYSQAADELMMAAANLEPSDTRVPQDVLEDVLEDSRVRDVLVARAVQLPNMVKRVQRIVASGNALSVAPAVVEHSLGKQIESGHFNPTGFALTRFDHGTYVFEPLLRRLNPNSATASPDALDKLLLLIGTLSHDAQDATIVHFRDTFSMKPDLKPQNQDRFETLVDAVQRGQFNEIG